MSKSRAIQSNFDAGGRRILDVARGGSANRPQVSLPASTKAQLAESPDVVYATQEYVDSALQTNLDSLRPVPGYLLHPNESGAAASFRQIPVVQMHNFADTNTALGVLKDYVAWGYTPIFFSELIDSIKLGNTHSLPSKPIVFCDDDGGASSYTALYPALQSLGLKCTYWLVPDWIDGLESNPPNGGTFMESNPITWAQAIEMQESDLVEFHSHTLSHGSLRLISGPRTFSANEDGSGAGADYAAAKARIESQIPGSNVRFNACPYGVINEAAIASLKSVGCEANRVSQPGLDLENDYDGSGPGGFVYPWTDPFRIPVADSGNFKYIKHSNIFGNADPDGNMVQNGKFIVTQRGWTLPSGWSFASGVALPTNANPSSGPVLQGVGTAAATGAYHTDLIPVGLYGAYTIDWWVKCSGAPASSCRLAIDTFLNINDSVPVSTLTEVGPIGGTTAWTSKRWYVQADATYQWIRLRYEIVGATSGSQMQVWNVRARRTRTVIPGGFN